MAAPEDHVEILPPDEPTPLAAQVAPRPRRMHQPAPQTDKRGTTKTFPKVDLEEIEAMASVGMTTKQIAEALSIPPSIFGRMVTNDPYIQEAVDRGLARGTRMVTDALFGMAMKGNVAAAIFWLKNKGGWSDRQELDQRLQVENKMSFEAAVEALKAAGIDPGKV